MPTPEISAATAYSAKSRPNVSRAGTRAVCNPTRASRLRSIERRVGRDRSNEAEAGSALKRPCELPIVQDQGWREAVQEYKESVAVCPEQQQFQAGLRCDVIISSSRTLRDDRIDGSFQHARGIG